MRPHQPGYVDFVSGIWAALHHQEALTFRQSEVQCLRMLAMAADDDLASNLLLRKLRMATIIRLPFPPSDLVVMNSRVSYRTDGGPLQHCQLRHPSPHAPDHARSLVSLIGAGLMGMKAGQACLWPDEMGVLQSLQVVEVRNDGAIPSPEPARSCVHE